MVDLNLTYGTVADGASSVGLTFANPTYANDGNLATDAQVGAAVVTAGTWHRRLKTDLGLARAVSGMQVIYGSTGDEFASLEYSTDGASWTPSGITPSPTVTVVAVGQVQDWIFPSELTYRYWRMVKTITASGLQFLNDITVSTWSITEGTPPQSGVYADWNNDGFGAADDDNITSHVASWRIQRGASAELTGGTQPGTCTLVLNNPSDDRYNPLNAGGPLYGLLTDGVPIWVGVTAAGLVSGNSEYGLFGGNIASITPVPQGGLGRAAKVEITCEDALARLGRTPVTVADDVYRSQAAIRELVLTAAGETSWDLASEPHTVPISSFDGMALAALEEVNKGNGSRHFVRPASTYGPPTSHYTTRNRMWRLDGTTDASLDAGTDHVTGTDGWRLSADTVINRQKVTVTPIRFSSAFASVWEARDVPITVKSGTPYTVWVTFDDYVKDPVLDYVSSGSALTATLTPFGETAKVVLTSAGTTTVTRLSIEGQMVRRGNDISAVVEDATSAAAPRGYRSGSDLSSAFTGVTADAQGLAGHIVWRYASPQFRPTLTVHNWMPEQFDIDLFDVIAVTIDELAMNARLFEVVGLTHECDLASADVVHHVTTYVLQECRVQADPGWFVIGSSTLNSTDILGY